MTRLFQPTLNRLLKQKPAGQADSPTPPAAVEPAVQAPLFIRQNDRLSHDEWSLGSISEGFERDSRRYDRSLELTL